MKKVWSQRMKSLGLTVSFFLTMGMFFKGQATPKILEEQISSGVSLTRFHYPTVSSTQDQVKSNLTKKNMQEKKWIAVSADQQTSGRGMWNRPWVCPKGNVCVSYCIPWTSSDIGKISHMSMVAGLALAKTIDDYGLPSQLRWVNNVLVEDKKIGGVLCEQTDFGNGTGYCTVGFGLNVNMGAEDLNQIDQPATSLKIEKKLAHDMTVAEVIQKLTKNLWYYFNQSGQLFMQEYKAKIEAYALFKLVNIFDGKNTYYGKVVKVTDEGYLMLNSHQVPFQTGEISPPYKGNIL